MPHKTLLDYFTHLNNRKSVSYIEETAIKKITAYFEGKVTSNRSVFLYKLLVPIADTQEKKSIKDKIEQMSEKEFNELLILY